MSHPIVRRLVVVLALSALLGSPATSLAAGPRSTARHSRAQTAAARAPMSWLWNALVRGWEKEGCRIDPNGLCITVAAPVSGDNLRVTANETYGWLPNSN
jgi:hypothetical protein